VTISGERIEQLDIFCHITGFTSDFLSFIDMELSRFFHGALQFIFLGQWVGIEEAYNRKVQIIPDDD